MKTIKMLALAVIFSVFLCVCGCNCKKDAYGNDSDYIEVSHNENSVIDSISDESAGRPDKSVSRPEKSAGRPEKSVNNPVDNLSNSENVSSDNYTESSSENHVDNTVDNQDSEVILGDDYGPAVSVP